MRRFMFCRLAETRVGRQLSLFRHNRLHFFRRNRIIERFSESRNRQFEIYHAVCTTGIFATNISWHKYTSRVPVIKYRRAAHYKSDDLIGFRTVDESDSRKTSLSFFTRYLNSIYHAIWHYMTNLDVCFPRIYEWHGTSNFDENLIMRCQRESIAEC